MNDAGKNPKPQTETNEWFEYVKWISSQDWSYFWTGTFRKNYTPDGARRACQRYYRNGYRLQFGIFFIESGSLYGKVHLHGLLLFREQDKPAVDTFQRWYDSYGYNRLEIPRSVRNVSTYCAKYLLKHAKDETYFII